MASDKIIKMQIHKIDKIAEKKQDELENEQFNKYSHIFNLAYKILKTQPVLLYGGMAINEMLPDKLKIYKKNSLPDIDIFSKNAENIATKVVEFFKKNGYPMASFGDALHEGTYKIYVEGIQVIDITNISTQAFKRLSYKSNMSSFGIKIVNSQFIRMSLHMMLSQPNDAHRWNKVFQRLIAFYKVNPPMKCKFKIKTSSNNSLSNYSEIYDYIKTTDFVIFGHNELKDFFNNKNIPNIQQPYIQLLVKEDVYEIATDIIEKLGKSELKLSKVYDADDFIPRHIFIYNGKTKIAALYTATSCVSYINYNGFRYASIHTIIRIYMLMLFSSYSHFKTDYNNIECLVNMLSIIQYKNIGSKKKIFKEFIMDCYGIHKGLITLKREKLIRYAK